MNEKLQNSYDRVATDYAADFRDEMNKKPFDRKMLDLLIEKVGDSGTICDMGCGPGQIANYLSARGAKARGIDLSSKMIEQARKLNSSIPFQQGDMLNLINISDDSFAGIAAFYSLIHVPRADLNQALSEFKRVLRPSGTILLAFHIGKEIKHLDQWWEKTVSLDFYFFEIEEMKNYLEQAGFKLQEVIQREPYAEVEFQSQRAYIFAQKI